MISRNRFTLLIISALYSIYGFSQAGEGLYRFLDYSPSARITALGGSNVSLADHDLAMIFQNPALMSAKTHNTLTLNYANFPVFMYGTAAYSYNINARNFLTAGAQYADYGTFSGRDKFNQNTADFTVKDVAMYLSYARLLSEKLTAGITVKPIFLTAEQKTSFGLGFDAGLAYHDTEGGFAAGLVFKNLGAQLKGYFSDQTGQYTESLPFNITAGLSQKLKYAPLRFSLTLHDLQRWDLSYPSANQQIASKKINFFDMAFRHAIIGVEFVPTNNFYVALGYNHRRAAELGTQNFKSLAGFSIGAGVKIAKFHAAFGMAQYQQGISMYHFTLASSLEEFGL